MSKTLLAVNTLTAVGSQPYASHFNLGYRMRDAGDEVMLFNGYRMSIDRFRNRAAALALQGEFDYLMFLDDDVCVNPYTYQKLKARDVDIVTPIVYIRSYPFKPMFFKSIDLGNVGVGLEHYDDWEEKVKIGDLLPVAAIGFSCCLIKCELLKKIPPAWFVTGVNHTEDVYFCIKAKQTLSLQGEDVGIYVDTSLDSGHMLDPEFVSHSSVGALRRFYEDMDPSLKVKTVGGDSSNKLYVEMNKKRLDQVEFQKI